MILRLDRLPVDLPVPESPDANAAAALQELLGGKFGEMSHVDELQMLHGLLLTIPSAEQLGEYGPVSQRILCESSLC